MAPRKSSKKSPRTKRVPCRLRTSAQKCSPKSKKRPSCTWDPATGCQSRSSSASYKPFRLPKKRASSPSVMTRQRKTQAMDQLPAAVKWVTDVAPSPAPKATPRKSPAPSHRRRLAYESMDIPAYVPFGA